MIPTATSVDYSKAELEEIISYRQAMYVTKVRRYASGSSYPVCPRCCLSLDREYMRFCDRCGQKLCWEKYGRSRSP